MAQEDTTPNNLSILIISLQRRGYTFYSPPPSRPSKRLVIRALAILARSAGMAFEAHLCNVVPFVLGIICGLRLPENESIYIDALSNLGSMVTAAGQIFLDYVDIDALAAIVTNSIKGGRKPSLSVKLAVYQLAAKISKAIIVPESVDDFHALIMPLGQSCGIVESSDRLCAYDHGSNNTFTRLQYFSFPDRHSSRKIGCSDLNF